MVLRYLIEKEFKQFKRNQLLPRMVIVFPILIMLVFPWVASFEVSNVRVTIVDNDNSTISRRLIEKINGSNYFTLNGVVHSYGEAYADVEQGGTDVILDLPNNMEKSLLQGEGGRAQISSNCVNGIKGNLGMMYINRVVGEFLREQMIARGMQIESPVNVIVKNRYNAYLDSKQYMIPALMTMIIIVICGFMPTLNLVSEKEKGTIEQINVTPISKWQFILAKLIPFWLIATVILTICFVLSWLIYGYVPKGSFFVLYLAVWVFSVVMSGAGLLVANYSETMQQSVFLMFFIVVCFMLMSGLFTPINSMPQWAQYLTTINPPKYFIVIMRDVFQKGASLTELSSPFLSMIALAVIVNVWAVVSYRKRS